MRQIAGLRGLGILQQGAGRADCRAQAFGPEAGQRRDLELVTEQALGRVKFKIPVRLASACGFQREIRLPGFRIKDFSRANAFQRRGNLIAGDFGQDEFATGQIQAGDAGGIACRGQRQ